MAIVNSSKNSTPEQQSAAGKECWFHWMVRRIGLKNDRLQEDDKIGSIASTTSTNERRNNGRLKRQMEGWSGEVTERLMEGRMKEVKIFTL